jgi:hypothetical protein
MSLRRFSVRHPSPSRCHCLHPVPGEGGCSHVAAGAGVVLAPSNRDLQGVPLDLPRPQRLTAGPVTQDDLAVAPFVREERGDDRGR